LPADYWYVDSIASGNVNLKTDPLVVAPGNAQSIEVRLRNDSGQLQIKSEGADPASPSQVVIIAVPEGGGKPRQNSLYTPGQTLYLSLPPGRYSIYAFQDFEDLAFADPEVMKDFTRFAQSVDVQPKQHTEITVHVNRKTQ